MHEAYFVRAYLVLSLFSLYHISPLMTPVLPRLLLYPEDNHPLANVETEADVLMNTIMWFASH